MTSRHRAKLLLAVVAMGSFGFGADLGLRADPIINQCTPVESVGVLCVTVEAEPEVFVLGALFSESGPVIAGTAVVESCDPQTGTRVFLVQVGVNGEITDVPIDTGLVC